MQQNTNKVTLQGGARLRFIMIHPACVQKYSSLVQQIWICATVDARNPAYHLGCIKPCKSWGKTTNLNWWLPDVWPTVFLSEVAIFSRAVVNPDLQFSSWGNHRFEDTYQVIQSVTFLSPIVGGHLSIERVTDHHPRKGHQQNCHVMRWHHCKWWYFLRFGRVLLYDWYIEAMGKNNNIWGWISKIMIL